MSRRRLDAVHPAPPPHWVGDGFFVRPLFASLAFSEAASPFLMLDYAAPAAFRPTDEPPGVGAHPHKGFETVTIVYEGEIEHRDSAGNAGKIGPGDVQWMTAGSGLLHEEFHSREQARRGGRVSMAQLWVNLPARDKSAPPAYQSILSGDIPTVELADGAGRLRVVAGAFGEARGPARTFSPLHVWDVELAPGARVEWPVAAGDTAMVALFDGDLESDGERIDQASLLTFAQDGDTIALSSRNGAKLLVLAGAPLGEPIAHYGPFVMNTDSEIRDAIADFRAGKMGKLDALV